MTDTPARFCAHANANGDASRCACQLGPDASREAILAFEAIVAIIKADRGAT